MATGVVTFPRQGIRTILGVGLRTAAQYHMPREWWLREPRGATHYGDCATSGPRVAGVGWPGGSREGSLVGGKCGKHWDALE